LGREVLDSIRRRSLVGDADQIAVALSGGPDSVALAWVLRELEAHARWRLAGLIHVHHGLRGASADADEAFCRALAARFGLPIHVAHVDVAALARDRHVSVETAGRQARYAAFEIAAAEMQASVVATGHTLDDQAETVLLRLLRGAGGRGLSGIRPRRGPYVRPLIDCRRALVVEYLAERGEPSRQDLSNRDVSIPRNRVRRALLPIVDAHWRGGVAALARFAELAADDEACLMDFAGRTGALQVDEQGERVQVEAPAVNMLPAALARRVIRGAIEAAGGTPSLRDVEAIRRLARADKTGGRLDLSQLTVERQGSTLSFERAGHASAGAASLATGPRPLAVPGEVTLSETGATIRASVQKGAEAAAVPVLSGQTALLQADALPRPLAVRYRRPGDRLRPLGAPGSRKLQDWFVDRKVPRRTRDRVPLVVDARDRIVWVAGFTIAHEYRVTAPAEGVVVLELNKGNQ
jgi:tRNA(Ile)-lysidine synthase